MTKLQTATVTLATIFGLSGCTPMVGGECRYQDTTGRAIVQSLNQNCIVDFYVKKRVGSQWVDKKMFEAREAECLGEVEVAKEYKAIYSEEIEGSCTPYILRVYGKE